MSQVNNFETNTTTYTKTQELNSLDLINCLRYLRLDVKESKNIVNCTERNLSNIYKELYKRFIVPFYIPLLVLTPLLLILSSKENTNYFRIKIITFLIGLFFIIFSETTIKMISTVITKNLIISIMPFVCLSIIYLLFLKKTKFNLTIK